MSGGGAPAGPAVRDVYARFFGGTPASAEVIDTSRGDADFRHTVILTADEGEKRVLKIAANGFTSPERIRMWQRTAEEYRALGYYAPRIFADRDGAFPEVAYMGRRCVAYAEEFCGLRTAEDRASAWDGTGNAAFMREIWTMTAKVAAKRFWYTDLPSAWCLFDTFCPGDEVDEVLENALEWKRTADALPKEFSARVRRIWETWTANRASLGKIYGELPASVFQADLNPTNLLVDETGAFAGVCDFNLAGREVFLNYLMRENFGEAGRELELIRDALRISRGHYAFSEAEKEAALPLYRCLKPLWYTRAEDLKEAADDPGKIRRCLNETEECLTADIDFADCMG